MTACMAGCFSFFGVTRGSRVGKPAWAPLASELLKEYSVGDAIGSGAYGVVFAAEATLTGERVAVKMMDRSNLRSHEIETEAAFLRILSHRNVVGYHDLVFGKRHACLVMENFAGGDLVEGLQRRMKAEQGQGAFPCQRFVHIGSQMAAAVQYLHSNLIVHRDVKSDNFMMDRSDILDPQCRIALGDFGAARVLKSEEERMRSAVGTKMFWAPEFYALNYGMKVDVWAMGVVMYSLLVYRFPFRDEADVRRREPIYPKRLRPECKDYLRSMLRKSESKRPSAAQVAAHLWIRKEEEEPVSREDSEDFSPAETCASTCSSSAKAKSIGNFSSVSTKQGSDSSPSDVGSTPSGGDDLDSSFFAASRRPPLMASMQPHRSPEEVGPSREIWPPDRPCQGQQRPGAVHNEAFAAAVHEIRPVGAAGGVCELFECPRIELHGSSIQDLIPTPLTGSYGSMAIAAASMSFANSLVIKG
eukprot:CAMPEP_0115386676 /NCGR_PEP_ID=MMETSP0271-20121206/8267_1 /TAXON_ID=71861 /ORGANISM="Scrippsiella trochoidea, Strain CCMP3099" /LENGTH=471 /DNA_ID=CAMNT_0002810111 /DNA_START=34 /DNA_END=1447 /DNA_ORIENTATION=-